MSDPLREIEALEADPEAWWLAMRYALAFQEQLEREQGTASQRILRTLPKPVVESKPAVKPPKWRYG